MRTLGTPASVAWDLTSTPGVGNEPRRAMERRIARWRANMIASRWGAEVDDRVAFETACMSSDQ